MKLGLASSRTCRRTSSKRDGSMIAWSHGDLWHHSHAQVRRGRWADCPADGPSTTAHNRWNRWSCRGIWILILAALTGEVWIAKTAPIGSIFIKAGRSAGGAKGHEPMPLGSCVAARQRRSSPLSYPWKVTRPRPNAWKHIGFEGGRNADRWSHRYEAGDYRTQFRCQPHQDTLREQDTIPFNPGQCNRKRLIQYDEYRYKDRWWVEAIFCRLKDFLRITTRHDKLVRNFLSAKSLAAAIAFWL